MALTANRDVDHYVDQELRSYPVKAGQTIYKGAFVVVEESSGYAMPFVSGAGAGTANFFVGIAYEEADNASGSNGDISVRVFTKGDFEHDVTSGSITTVGDKVYATSDDTLVLIAGAGQNVFVGRVQGYLSGNTCIIRLHGMADSDAT